MSLRPYARRHAGPNADHRNPFDAGIPGHDAELADAVRRARWVALDLGAQRFAMFLRVLRKKGPTLAPSLDSDHPALAVETRRLAALAGENLAKRIVESTLPFWWSPERRTDPILGALDWAERMTPAPAEAPAIAFPVHSDRGQAGLLVFFAPTLAIDVDTLMEAHSRCFALFNVVTRTSATDKSGAPAITPRELECLRLTADGHTSEDIAALLGVSAYTANDHIAQAIRKLNAVTRTHAVAKALRLGLIE